MPNGFPELQRWLRRVGPLLGGAMFALAVWVLQDWLRAQHYQQLLAALAAIPTPALWQAAAFTVAAHAVLSGYDLMAMRFIGRRMAPGPVAATAFLANALANNFGDTLLTGGAVRYWTYTAAGLSASEIARVVLFCSLTFWLGFLVVGGVVFVAGPVDLPPALQGVGATSRPLGVLFLLLLGAYLALALLQAATRRPLQLRGVHVQLPSVALTLGQLVIASLDLCLMAAVFYVLLPGSAAFGYAYGLTVFLVAMVAGNLSLVPGGLGVFESVVVLLLGARIPAADLAAALLVFRGFYFIAPLFAAALLLAARARPLLLHPQRRLTARARSLPRLAPPVLAGAVFVVGAMLLFSGSTPAAAGRLELLGRLLALPLIEASHFLASLAGAALLLLARGLQRRLDAAWLLALVLLAAAAAFSLAKGWDYEEATVVALAATALLPLRGQFYRRSSLLHEPFSAAWTAAVAIVLASSAFLAQFANRHALLAGLSWWEFALQAQAPRSVRALGGAVSLAALFGLYRLLRPLRPPVPTPSAQDIERARPIVEQSPRTYANLVFRGDKALLFSQSQDAFLMYGRSGRSWVALGDPVGAASGVRELRWRFRDLCDRHDGWCVFFQVSGLHRADYAELGLGLTPVGEQARVDLAGFDRMLERHGGLRRARARLQREGGRVEIVPREAVPPLVPALAQVSQAWLAAKPTREKGFSNASFDAHYLQQFPVAVVRTGQGIVAFANVWCGAGRQELSVDLMRYLPTAPKGAMDFLFCGLMQWGRDQGYRWFDFGMAPLSGLEAQRDAPVWGRLATLLYRHGEHFYNFEGLRHYKAKFDPVWSPLYLASPGGVALPLILLDITALTAGSLVGVVSKRGSPRRA